MRAQVNYIALVGDKTLVVRAGWRPGLALRRLSAMESKIDKILFLFTWRIVALRQAL